MSYALPTGLGPWAPHLAALPTDVALALAPWVGRLALAIGPARAGDQRGDGEPDGYRGLSRRGSYERLVAQEWGIAELFPDEFLRRAVGGEHLFHELARKQPRGARQTIAVLSAGPAQIGAPRLAHLAILVVLARRAEAAGATLAWGTLEDAAHQLALGVDEAGIHRLLAARTGRAAESDALEVWRLALGADAARDAWFVGDERQAARAAALGWRALAVRDVIEPDVRALEVDIVGTRARVRLELPADDACVRALRPSRPRRAPVGPDPSSYASGRALDVRFARGGRTLLVRLADGGLESRPVPSSLREVPGNGRRWRPNLSKRPLVGYGLGKRGIIAGEYEGTSDFVELTHGASGGVSVRVPGVALLPEPGVITMTELEPKKPGLVIAVGATLGIVKDLAEWPHAVSLEMRPLAAFASRPVVASLVHHHRVVWAESDSEGGVHLLEHAGRGQRHLVRIEAKPGTRVVFGHRHGDEDLAALQGPDGRWGVVSTRENTLVPTSAPADGVVGPCVYHTAGIVAQVQSYQLAWFGTSGRHELFPPSTTDIVSAAVSGDNQYVAWLNRAGIVTIFNCLVQQIIGRFHYQGGGRE